MVKAFLKTQIENLEEIRKESAKKDAEKMNAVLEDILTKELKLRETKKVLKVKLVELETKVEEKKKTFTEAEARELILKKFYDGISFQLERYLGAEEKRIVLALEKLWDKYQVSLEVIGTEREKSAKQLAKFLNGLGYSK